MIQRKQLTSSDGLIRWMPKDEAYDGQIQFSAGYQMVITLKADGNFGKAIYNYPETIIAS